MSSSFEKDTDNLEKFLEQMRSQRSSTPKDERPSCPECGSISIDQRGQKYCTPESIAEQSEAYWKCKRCKAVFDEPKGGKSA